MQLWIEWFRGVVQLREACSRNRTFVWMCLALVGFSIRTELLGHDRPDFCHFHGVHEHALTITRAET